MVLVPNEAGNVRVPKPQIVPQTVLPALDRALSSGDLNAAYASGDAALSRRLGSHGVELLREGVATLEAWRIAKPAIS